MWDVMWDEKMPMGPDEVSQVTSPAAGGYCSPSNKVQVQDHRLHNCGNRKPWKAKLWIRGYCCTPGGKSATCKGAGKRNYMRSPGWRAGQLISAVLLSLPQGSEQYNPARTMLAAQWLARAGSRDMEHRNYILHGNWVKENNTCLSF